MTRSPPCILLGFPTWNSPAANSYYSSAFSLGVSFLLFSREVYSLVGNLLYTTLLSALNKIQNYILPSFVSNLFFSLGWLQFSTNHLLFNSQRVLLRSNTTLYSSIHAAELSPFVWWCWANTTLSHCEVFALLLWHLSFNASHGPLSLSHRAKLCTQGSSWCARKRLPNSFWPLA